MQSLSTILWSVSAEKRDDISLNWLISYEYLLNNTD